MNDYYPPAGFHFSVSFDKSITDKEIDGRFQSVSGLNIEFETETIKEGGENRFEYVLPIRSKYPTLILKRGMFTGSNVIEWCMNAFNNLIIQPTDILISLLNEEHEPLLAWNVKSAWPLKWDVSDLDAMENKLVLETLEMSYQYFTLQKKVTDNAD